MNSITACVLTKNEEKNLPACLASIAWADEIHVVDCGSTDGTIEIAKNLGAKVFHHDWQGFSAQRKYQWSLPQTKWLFWIDADERCSPELQKEIQQLSLNESGKKGFTAPRLTYFHKRPIYHCGWYPDRVPRLFCKDSWSLSGNGLHSKILIAGGTGELQGHIDHWQDHSLAPYLQKMANYATESAYHKYQEGKRCGLIGAMAIGPLRFLKTYFLQRGLLDGMPGLEISFLGAMSDTMKYLALYRLSSVRANGRKGEKLCPGQSNESEKQS